MSNSKLGTTEAIMVILAIIVPFTVVSIPRIFINEIKSSVLLNIMFVSIIAVLFVLLICILFKKFPGLDILDISNFLGGNVFKNIIGFIFISYFIISSAILLRNFCEGLKVIYYPYTNVIFIILMFIIGVGISNHLGFNATIKTSTLVLPFVLVSILLLFFGNFENFVFQRIFPILGKGFYNTFILGLTNMGCFAGIAYLYFLPPLLKKPEKFKKIAIVSTIITSLFILICIATLLFMFSIFISTDEIMPMFSASRYIEFGTFFQRFESVFLLIWIIAFCCYLSISFKFSTYIFKKMFSLEDCSQITYIFAMLGLAICIFPKNYAISSFFETKLYRIITICIAFILSISILILSNLKKKKVGDKNEEHI